MFKGRRQQASSPEARGRAADADSQGQVGRCDPEVPGRVHACELRESVRAGLEKAAREAAAVAAAQAERAREIAARDQLQAELKSERSSLETARLALRSFQQGPSCHYKL